MTVETPAKAYRVRLTRDITESTIVEVTARTEADAESAAIEKLADMDAAEWTVDDGPWNHGNVYATGFDILD